LRFQSDTASTERDPACHFATTAQSFSNKHLDFNNICHDMQAASEPNNCTGLARRAKLCHVWSQQSQGVSVHLDPLGTVRAWRKLTQPVNSFSTLKLQFPMKLQISSRISVDFLERYVHTRCPQAEAGVRPADPQPPPRMRLWPCGWGLRAYFSPQQL